MHNTKLGINKAYSEFIDRKLNYLQLGLETMAKYRVWYGDDPTYKNVTSLAEAIKFIKKKPDFDESNSGVEELVDNEYWDEWLDEDDQNVHEHLYMYGGKSKYLRAVVEEEDDEEIDDEDIDDEDLDDEEEEDIDDEETEEGVDSDDEDLDERLMDVIGGGRTGGGDSEESFDEDDEDLDDEEDIEDEEEEDLDDEDDDDFDDEDLDDEDDEKDY